MLHTKGTWYGKDGQVYPEETGKTLALIPYYDKDNAEQRANLALIAAAPELLEACREAKAVLDLVEQGVTICHCNCRSLKRTLPIINDAISKAEGK